MVGSDCSFIFCRSRLTNTEATRLRSSDLPVSFSTIDASVTSCSGVLIGRSGVRRSQISASARLCACCMRAITCSRVVPRGNLYVSGSIVPSRGNSRTDPENRSLSESRATICSEVRPSGIVTACCTTLPSTIVPMTSRRLAFFWKRYSPGLSSERAFNASTAPMNAQRLLSMTPSRCRASAMSVIPARAGMLTILSSRNGPGASIFCLP